MKAKLKDSLKMGLAFIIAFAILQFVIGQPAQAVTQCGCNCKTYSPSGVSFCGGTYVECRLYCSGKVTIVEWSADFLTQAWSLWNIVPGM